MNSKGNIPKNQQEFDRKDSRSKEPVETGIIKKALCSFKKGELSIAEAAESAGVSRHRFREIALNNLAAELKPNQRDMKLIIFAGGTGTRFWPLSRKKLPKHFKKMFNGRSTFQLAVERISGAFDDIYVSTNKEYIPLVKEQLSDINVTIPDDHLFGEPEKRNVAPAVGYSLIRLRKKGHSGPVAILWADHLMEHEDNFISILKKGETLVRETPQQLVFIGEKSRYPESNLGWIHVGDEKKKGQYEFKEWCYKPTLEESKKMHESGEWYWNPGYFVMDLELTLCLYRVYVPDMYEQLLEIEKSLETDEEEKTINRVYPQMEALHFDRIIERIPPQYAVVLPTDLGWSDVGTFYALKEILVGKGPKNAVQGFAVELSTTDSLIINEEEKLVATIGLDGMIVVNTPEALLVVHKDNVVKISKLIEKLEEDKKLKKFI